MIVGSETVATLMRLFGREDQVAFAVGRNGIVASSPTTRITSKLIDGCFPDIERVIPPEVPTGLSLDRDSCLSAISAVEIFQPKDGGNIIECGADRDGLAMATGGVSGESEGFAVADAEFDGQVKPFGISSKYLRTVLGAFTGEVVRLGITDPGSPIRVTCESDDGVLSIVMPMRVTRSRLEGRAST